MCTIGFLGDWWSALQPLNQWFFVAAAFFTVFFLWQFVAALIGLGSGDDGADAHVDHAADPSAASDAHDTLAAFKLLSVRSIIAFATLFTWACALYLRGGTPLARCLAYGFLWGLAAMLLVSATFYMMRRLTESGTVRLQTCVGTTGNVYLDIPANGTGEVRVFCGGVSTHLRARCAGGAAARAGMPVRVLRVIGPGSVEVEIDDSTQQRKGNADEQPA